MPLSIGPELAAAIDQLYVAFQAYPLPAKTYPCPCCHSVDSDRPLYSRPLRKLRPEDLEQYSRDALLVWGGVDEFRHFLPRIFEITVSAERFSFVDREIVFSKLHEGEWRTWPQAEQAAVWTFLLVLWRTAMDEPPSDDLSCTPEIEPWLCALAHADQDLSPYLDEWLQAASSSAVWNLAAAIYRTGLPQARIDGLDAFWKGHMDQVTQISEWMRGQTVRDKLDKAAETYINEPFAEELLAASSSLS